MGSSNFAEFEEKLSRAKLRGQWKSEEYLRTAIGGPPPAGLPFVWKWEDVLQLLDEGGRAMPESLEARRSLIFQNPGLQRGTTHTMNMGVQMVLPGETAFAHRHSISALRFVMKGDEKLSTVIDGRDYEMNDNDLILTPTWSWHEHKNAAARPLCWLDVLDVPLVLGLNQTFYEPGSEAQHPFTNVPQANLIYRYPWKDVAPQLADAPVDAYDGKIYSYRNKEDGFTLPTLACQAQRLPAGFSTRYRRRSSSSVYYVISGDGAIDVEGSITNWKHRDCFVVPNWVKHRLINNSNSDHVELFSVHDTPLLYASGLFREEVE